MKFSDVPVGATFKYKSTLFVKIKGSDWFLNSISINLVPLEVGRNTEVELVTKCVNCKYINKNSGELEVPIDGLKHYCHRIRADLSESHYGLDRDIETFSCSFFEMKD